VRSVEGIQIGALGDLCRTYWYPLYAFIRRIGFQDRRLAEEAGKLTEALAGAAVLGESPV